MSTEDRRSFFKKLLAAPIAAKAVLSDSGAGGLVRARARLIRGTLHSFTMPLQECEGMLAGSPLPEFKICNSWGPNWAYPASPGAVLSSGVTSSTDGVVVIDPLLPTEETAECPATTTHVVHATPPSSLSSRFTACP